MRTKNMNRDSFIRPHTLKKLFGVGVIGCLTLGCIGTVSAGPMEQARRMHDRLAGVPPTSEVLNAMAGLIQAGRAEDAAKIVMEPTPNTATDVNGATVDNSKSKQAFYSVSLKNFVTPWTNVEKSVHDPLNDYTALVIGLVRDGLPFTDVLTADYTYIGTNTNPSPSLTDNAHYEALENNHVDLSDSNVFSQVPQSATASVPNEIATAIPSRSAGIITTRAAGQAFFKAGTNRRMFSFMTSNFLCRDIEQLKDTTGVPDRVRQDVSRSPGGDSSIYLNSCTGCHIGMDPLTAAYAYFDYQEDNTPDDGVDNGFVTYSETIGAGHKYLINATNFEQGYITTNDDWENYWRVGPNAKLNWGWNSTLSPGGSGSGPKSMGQEIAASEAFAQCQVEKVYKFVCLQDPKQSDATTLKNITAAFRTSTYNLRGVFASVAPMCMGD